ncbi:unnamed protein product [Caretta caretta]
MAGGTVMVNKQCLSYALLWILRTTGFDCAVWKKQRRLLSQLRRGTALSISCFFPPFTWAASAVSVAAAGAAAVWLPVLHPGMSESGITHLHTAKEEQRWNAGHIFFLLVLEEKGCDVGWGVLGFFLEGWGR